MRKLQGLVLAFVVLAFVVPARNLSTTLRQ